MTDAFDRAYALLGLTPGATPEQIRKQYKALVRRWHPDRFAGDPQGQSEAAVRMRAINDAYRLLIGRSPNGRPRPVSEPRPSGRALSRDEIDNMVRALGTDGPVDLFLASLRAVGRRFLMPLGVVFVAALCLQMLVTLLRGGLAGALEDPRPVIYAAVVTIGLVVPHLQSNTARGKR